MWVEKVLAQEAGGALLASGRAVAAGRSHSPSSRPALPPISHHLPPLPSRKQLAWPVSVRIRVHYVLIRVHYHY